MSNTTKNVYDMETVMLDDANSELIIIDQTLLPNETVYLKLKTQEEIWEAIYKLRVRGAPAIGVAAAYGIYLGAKAISAQKYEEFYSEFIKLKEYLASSRPTAVNLFWALDRMDEYVKANKDKSIDDIKNELLKESHKIKEEDTCEQSRKCLI